MVLHVCINLVSLVEYVFNSSTLPQNLSVCVCDYFVLLYAYAHSMAVLLALTVFFVVFIWQADCIGDVICSRLEIRDDVFGCVVHGNSCETCVEIIMLSLSRY